MKYFSMTAVKTFQRATFKGTKEGALYN